ncbi:MAG TPA: hypothetical protein VGO93_05625 [Candidatus Xenobia bacterium]|jgi:hypothetical protein
MKRYALGIGAVGLGLLLSVGRVHSEEPKPAPGLSFAVVDYQKLLAAHKDYKNLSVLDEEIKRLTVSLEGPGSDDPRLAKEVQRQLEALQKQFKVRFQAKNEAAIASLKADQAQMEIDLRSYAAQLNQQFKEQVSKLPKAPPPPSMPADMAGTKTEIQGEMKSYFQDLALLRQRQLAARRLELSRGVEQQLNTKKNELDAQLSAYEAQLNSESQQQKVNLELQKISAKNDDERNKIEQQLTRLKQDQEDKRQARRSELAAQFEAAKKDAMARIDGQIKTYEARIDADAQSKVAAEQQRLVHHYYPNAPNPQAVAAMQAQESKLPQQVAALKAEQSEMKGQFDARRRDLEGRFRAHQDEVKSQLQADYKQMKTEFDQQADALVKRIRERGVAVSKDEADKIAKIKTELKDMRAQRDRLYDHMQADLKTQVDTVAKKDNAPVVVGSYLVNNKCKDLTAEVLQAMSQ